MKAIIFAASLLVLAPQVSAADIHVSVNLGQPGFYGPIDVQNFGQPRVIYSNPIIIERPVHYVNQAPLYLRVPPGHAKKWSKHCGAYNACGRRVLFVQDSWYNNTYAPRYRAQKAKHDENGGHSKPHKSGKKDKHDDDHGKGHGKGKNKD